MSRDSDAPIPSALRDRLQSEDAEECTDLEAVWRLLGEAAPKSNEVPNPDDEWAALQARRPELASESDATPATFPQNGRPSTSHAAEQADRKRTRTDRRPSRSEESRWQGPWLGALAVVVIVTVGAAWIWRQPASVTAEPGQQRTAPLPDGSTVDLNSGTTLTYRRGFQTWPFVEADRRVVRLDGEAFFTVADGARPFVVETANAEVQVTGTRFNVRSWTATDSTTTVTVTDGQVRVRPRTHPDRSVTLSDRGETSQVRSAARTPTSPQARKIDAVLAWRQDGFAVTEAPLVQVVRDLERRYDTVIRLHETVTRRRAPLTLYYPNPAPLPTILRDVCTALDLNYRPTSQGYELFAEPNGR